MCGIAGFFGHTQRDPAIVTSMLKTILKRGPDAQSSALWNSAGTKIQDGPVTSALIHSRLSIIDPNPIANQPMSNDDHSVWICYNGEVYGWQEDAKQLKSLGFHFKSHSDTEFILHAYQAWGIEETLSKLRGMFAFCILDWRKKKVFLVRDRFGEKPLIYSYFNNELAFGSLVTTIKEWLPKSAREISAEGIDAYLAHKYIPAPRTILKNACKLENAHFLTFDLESRALTKTCYWHPTAEEGDWVAELDESIRLRTVADCPVGLFLSSGIDSSVIASRLVKQGFSHLPSFTAGFSDAIYDESQNAKHFADSLGIQNTTIQIPGDFSQLIDQVIEDLDEPFSDPSILPTWFLAKEAAASVRVVLVGDGGDELFAGYKRVQKHLKGSWRNNLTLPFPKIATSSNKGWQKIIYEMSIDWLSAYSLRFSGFTPNQRAFLQPDFECNQPHYWRMPERTGDKIIDLLNIDFNNYLPEYILKKSDLCTMAHGLEARAPFVDHILFNQIKSIKNIDRFTSPPKNKLKNLTPPTNTTKKMGFNPPLEKTISKITTNLEEMCHLSNTQINYTRIKKITNTKNNYEQIMQLYNLHKSLKKIID